MVLNLGSKKVASARLELFSMEPNLLVFCAFSVDLIANTTGLLHVKFERFEVNN